MKKIFITLSFVLLSFLTVQAQEEVKVRFGFEAGFNATRWGGDYADEFKTTFKPGFHVGGVSEFLLSEKWSIQPELLFSYEGTNSDVLDKGISAMYIKFPVVLYYNFKVGSGRLSPGVGAYVAGGIAGKVNDDENTFGYNALGRFNWGVQAKVAYEFRFGLFSSLGFSQGFTRSQNMGLTLSVGYKFPYSKWLSTTYYRKNIDVSNVYNE
jgi:hypothetical protein